MNMYEMIAKHCKCVHYFLIVIGFPTLPIINVAFLSTYFQSPSFKKLKHHAHLKFPKMKIVNIKYFHQFSRISFENKTLFMSTILKRKYLSFKNDMIEENSNYNMLELSYYF